MAARDAAGRDAHPDEHIAAEALHQRHAFAGTRGRLGADRAFRETAENLFDQPQTLLDLLDADPDTGVDVALVPHRNLEGELVVGRVAGCPARVKITTGRAADMAAGA